MYKKLCEFVCLLLIVITFYSCRTYKESVVFGDVIGFSDDVQKSYDKRNYKKPYDLQSEKEQIEMDQYIRNIPDGNNTVGYYALDVALDRLKYVKNSIVHNDPEMKYYILFLTDGLDNGSTAAAALHGKGHYKDIDDYIKKLNIKKESISSGKGYFKIYPILFTEGDLNNAKQQNKMSDVEFDTFTKNIMEGFRGASKGVSKPEVIVGDNLNDLVLQFIDNYNKISDFEFHIPRGYVNKRVRMNITDANGYDVSIEGLFVKNGSHYEFKEITYSNNLTATYVNGSKREINPTIIKENSKSSKGLLSVFTLIDLNYNGTNLKLDNNIRSKVEQQVENYGIFTANTEYASQAESRVKTYVMMVIDGSASFRENSKLAKEKAIEMKNVITGLDAEKYNNSPYVYVDLGLSVKWATCNLGASNPEDYGWYYAWGETGNKSAFTWENYKYQTSGNSVDSVEFSKYTTTGNHGILVDDKTILDPEDDAAHVKWGGNWRIPTIKEFQELYDNCDWTWISLNGHYGYKVKSNVPGYTDRSIFLPMPFNKEEGVYWSSTLANDDSRACVLYFGSDFIHTTYVSTRFAGAKIRPILPNR